MWSRHQLITHLNSRTSAGSAATPHDLIAQLQRNGTWRHAGEQDAHEFFLSLIDSLKDAALKRARRTLPLPPTISPVEPTFSVFGGSFTYRPVYYSMRKP